MTFAFGTWACVAPHSFFTSVAHFEPYNRHFTHDAGALQIGVGVSLLMAAWIDSAAVAALGGFVVRSAWPANRAGTSWMLSGCRR